MYVRRYDQEPHYQIRLTLLQFIFSESGISAAFKSRQLSRARLDQQLGTNVLGMSKQDAIKAFPYDVEEKEKSTTARIHSEHLLSSAAVNALTSKYMEVFESQLANDTSLREGVEVNLYEWLWHIVFRSSTTALCGSELLGMYPDFDKDYRTWEDGMLAMLFGTPRLFAREAYAARDASVAKLEEWLKSGYANTSEVNSDQDWEPHFGSRVMRKRHDLYAEQGLSIHGQAGFDLIFLAGILSNATPATGWLLLHILSPSSPQDLRPRIQAELQSCKRNNGSIDIPALVRLPLLNSAFHEVLRLYVDLLVVRQVDNSSAIGHHYVKQGEQIMAPTWMTHRNPAFFADPEIFDAERFLVQDAETEKLGYKATGLGGKYFPFGGGHYMCPGRTFAKQEVLGTVAVLLLNFDIKFIEFVKQSKSGFVGVGADRSGFPGLKNGYAGNQVVGIEGDMRVRIRRAQS
jgi:cytochrome P450